MAVKFPTDLPRKTNPISDDLLMIADSQAGNVAKTITLGGIDQSKANVVADPVAGNLGKLKADGNFEVTDIPADNVAQQDGYYSTLTAGMAENLVGQSEDTETFTTATTGGESDFGNGLAELAKIEGNGLAWNQLVGRGQMTETKNGVTLTKNNDDTYTLTTEETGASADAIFTSFNSGSDIYGASGHKLYIRGIEGGSSSTYFFYDAMSGGFNNIGSPTIVSNTSARIRFGFKVKSGYIATTPIVIFPQLIDLSLIYGLGNEPTTVAQVEADLAKLIAQKPYYQYNAGELYGVNKLHIVSYGQNLLNPTNGQARLAPYDWDTNSNKYGIAFRNSATASAIAFTPDATGVAETVTPDSNGIFTISGAGTLAVTMASGSAASDVYVWAVWDGKKDGIENYKPYAADTLEIDLAKVYGKAAGSDTMTQVFPNGMRANGIRTASVRDLVDVTNKAAAVKIGSRVYTEGDESDTSVITDKTNTWYALEDAVQYSDLKLSSDGGTTFNDLPHAVAVDNWGVWEQLPNDSTIPSGKDFTGVAAQVTSILPMNAPEAIDTFLQQGITTAENRAQAVNILAALKAQNIIGDYAVGETPTDKVFSVSVTPYVEPEPEQEP